MASSPKTRTFTGYQTLVIAILSLIQFTVILDFMVIAPLGAMLMKVLSISPAKFGLVVSAYAFSAGISGLLAAGFADRYDRKKFLLFFYAGFLLGTFLCWVAPTYEFLLVARIVTGFVGGVIASVSLAIVTDIFPYEKRSRVMGFVQMSFAVSQVAGIPIGIYLANALGWHAPFLLILILGMAIGYVIVQWMQPIAGHLENGAAHNRNALSHLGKTLAQAEYRYAYLAMGLLTVGGFLMMPFSTAFLVNNMAVTSGQLPLVFLFTGVASMFILPVVGRMSDMLGKFRIFAVGTIIASIMIVIFTHLSVTPLWEIVIVNIVLFAGLLSRMVPATALMTAVPEQFDRGAFMSINSSLQQISGGVASIIAGAIIVQHTSSGPLEHYDLLGYVCILSMVGCIGFLYAIHKRVEEKQRSRPVQTNVIEGVREPAISTPEF